MSKKKIKRNKLFWLHHTWFIKEKDIPNLNIDSSNFSFTWHGKDLEVSCYSWLGLKVNKLRWFKCNWFSRFTIIYKDIEFHHWYFEKKSKFKSHLLGIKGVLREYKRAIKGYKK